MRIDSLKGRLHGSRSGACRGCAAEPLSALARRWLQCGDSGSCRSSGGNGSASGGQQIEFRVPTLWVASRLVARINSRISGQNEGFANAQRLQDRSRFTENDPQLFM